jgi:thiol-disulfide isomerase/thioredoxin
MHHRRITLAIALGTLAWGQALAEAPPAPALTDGSGAPSGLPHPAIILFWADWCAPCHEEIADLAALERAAAPLPVIVVPLESDRRTRRALRHLAPERLRFVATGAIAFMQDLTGGAVGLPASLALDRGGRRCALKYGAVTPEDLATWRRQCAARPD